MCTTAGKITNAISLQFLKQVHVTFLKQKPRHKLLPSLIQNDFPKVHNIDRDINH